MTLRENDPGGQRLVAYVVARAAGTPDGRELRSFLQERLPAYMVPSQFVFLDALPRTPNWKVDRRALAVPARAASGREGPPAAPRSALEAELAALWTDVLRVSPAGIHDNFFELGGHSLLAGRLLARVRERFRADVSLRTFFAAPSVAGLATAVVRGLVERAGTGMARGLAELQALSDEEARRLLGDGRSGT